MQLSIIVPVYKNHKELKYFLRKISEQDSLDFEVVFVIDTNLENILHLIQNYINKIKVKKIIVFNSQRIGRNNAINSGLEVANGIFSTIVSTSNIFETNYVSKIQKLIKDKPADIIEFQGSMKEPIKLNGQMRKPINNVVNIKDEPSIIAFTYPFDFNKIWKTNIIKQATQNCFGTIMNSRFSIKHIYNAFFIAKTYSNSNTKIIVSKSYDNLKGNPLKIFEQWDMFQQKITNNLFNKYIEELLYAEFMHESIFLLALIGISKNKILINKVSQIYNYNLKNKFKKFWDNNKYAILRNKETQHIKEKKQIFMLFKIYKELW